MISTFFQIAKAKQKFHFCSFCKAKAYSDAVMIEHFEGKRHQKNSAHMYKKKMKFTCSFCDVCLLGENQMIEHFDTLEHKEMVASQTTEYLDDKCEKSSKENISSESVVYAVPEHKKQAKEISTSPEDDDIQSSPSSAQTKIQENGQVNLKVIPLFSTSIFFKYNILFYGYNSCFRS